MGCLSCGAATTATAKFCEQCGVKLNRAGRRRRPAAARRMMFCPECGRARRRPPSSYGAAVRLSLVAHIILILLVLGSYDLDSSKPRSPNLPVDRICPQRFQMTKDDVPVQIPMCLNVDGLSVDDGSIQSAVIVIHGSSRNAVSYQESIETAVRAVERQDVLIAAPQFLTVDDLEPLDPKPDVMTWRSSDWSQGDRSDGLTLPGRVSSFDVVDAIVDELVRSDRYPNLKQITIAGHSAGGQFVHRYAAGTSIDQRPSILLRQLAIKYVVANPSSYLYLFPHEPAAWNQECRGIDDYKYGLNDLNTYLRPLGPEGIRALYARKEVIILLGRLDSQLIDPSKDDSCEATAQGTHRLSRGILFRAHLDKHLGSDNHGTRLVVVPGVGHSARAMFTSPEGQSVLLGR
jgi:hypothetical protein